jgi:hypothetical protein
LTGLRSSETSAAHGFPAEFSVPDMLSTLHHAQRAVRRFQTKLTAPGSPIRHLKRAAHRACNLARVRERQAYGQKLAATMTPALARTVQELRDHGTAPFNEHLDAALLAELDAHYQKDIAPRAEAAQGLKTHRFFFELTREEDNATDNILVRFGLQDAVLAAVSAYLGTAPFFQRTKVLESRGIQQDKWEASQLWHRDYADSGAVWLWVYLSDVLSVEDGPYTYLPAPASRQVKNSFFPRRIRDEEIDGTELKSEIRRITGPRLTSFLVDSTSIYHMGSRLAPGHTRCIYMASFIDPVNHKVVVQPKEPLDAERMLLFHP